MKRIAIIGGGIAGLTAAWQLTRPHKAGAAPPEVVLFEASSRLGGIVETVCEHGFVIECGPDAWVTGKPWARQLAEELGLAPDLLPSNDATRKTYILRDGALVAMPDGMRMMVPADLAAVDASPLFSPQARQAFHDEPARAAELKAAAPQADESVAAFVRRHFGDEVLSTVGAPLLSGVFGGNVATLSVQAVMAPFVAMEREYGSLITALQSSNASRTTAFEPVFTTLRNGVGSLTDALVASLPPTALRLNTLVTALVRTPAGWTVHSPHGAEDFDEILLATPIHIAANFLRPTDPHAADLMQLSASSAIIVAFAFPAPASCGPALPHLPPGFGFLVPPPPPGSFANERSEDTLLAATFADQKFAGRAPAGGRLLRAFFGGNTGARLLTADDATLAALARTQLEAILKTGPLPGPVATVVRRWPRSLPQYAVGHLTRMAELDRRIHALGHLQLLGNGYRGVGLPDLIRDARAAANQATL